MVTFPSRRTQSNRADDMATAAAAADPPGRGSAGASCRACSEPTGKVWRPRARAGSRRGRVAPPDARGAERNGETVLRELTSYYARARTGPARRAACVAVGRVGAAQQSTAAAEKLWFGRERQARRPPAPSGIRVASGTEAAGLPDRGGHAESQTCSEWLWWRRMGRLIVASTHFFFLRFR
jgi:hypothetical protein